MSVGKVGPELLLLLFSLVFSLLLLLLLVELLLLFPLLLVVLLFPLLLLVSVGLPQPVSNQATLIHKINHVRYVRYIHHSC